MTENPVQILLIEDDKDCAELTVKILEHSAILNHVHVVHTGKDAIAKFSEIKPDLILLDWKLPDMTGEEVLAEARRAGDAVVVVLSAHQPEEMDSSPDYYISKPIDPMQFLMVLKSEGSFGFNVMRVVQ